MTGRRGWVPRESRSPGPVAIRGANVGSPSITGRVRITAASIAILIGAAWLWIGDPTLARVAMIGGVALILFLSEVIPPHATTLALVAGIPLVLGSGHSDYRLARVLSWAADPVLALFFGGLALGVAAARHGIDRYVAGRALAFSRHHRRRLLAVAIAATAAMSMWISNIAAAALILAALRPHLHQGERTEPFRRALLVGVAMGANFGGMATPIGTGPNAIAIASLEGWSRITFTQWMGFALPLTVGMLALGYVLIARVYRVEGSYQPVDMEAAPLSGRGRGLVAVFGCAIAAWITEPLHGISAPVIGLMTAAVLFAGGWLGREDLGRIDWPVLLLIAGGIVLGRLIEHSGLLESFARAAVVGNLPIAAEITAFVLAAAAMGAVMSNTASAAILIPLALALGLPHASAILIALGTSFGVLFTISSPPNAMAYGEGGLGAHDLLRIGLPLMLIGCLLIGITGPVVLRWVGIP